MPLNTVENWSENASWKAFQEQLNSTAVIFCFSSTLQEQKGELRKRLSYTTHKLEMLETEFDSTRQYLEIELRRAQEELEKVTEKLRRLVTNFLNWADLRNLQKAVLKTYVSKNINTYLKYLLFID